MKSRRLQFAQGLFDRLFGKPRRVQEFDGREAFKLQTWIQCAKRLEHIGVVSERQRGMQPADDMQFSNAQVQRLTCFLDNFFDTELKSIGITFLPRKRAKLAA